MIRKVLIDWGIILIAILGFWVILGCSILVKQSAPDCSLCHNADIHECKKNVKYFGKRWLK